MTADQMLHNTHGVYHFEQELVGFLESTSFYI